MKAIDIFRSPERPSPVVLVVPALLLLASGAVLFLPALASAKGLAEVVAGLSCFMLLTGWRATLPIPNDPLVDVILAGQIRREVDKLTERLRENEAEAEQMRRAIGIPPKA